MIYAVVFEKAHHNWAAYSRTFRDVSLLARRWKTHAD